jgi:arginine exporter protein ArgO
MDTIIFLKGLILGFVIAAPVGPIGVLCARRTLTHGRRAGFFSGMGAATADSIYGFIAAFGLTFVSNFLIGYQFSLRLVGGTFLCFLGRRRLFRCLKKIVSFPIGAKICRDVHFHVPPYAHESYDDLFFCSGLCRVWLGGHEG